MEDVSGRDLNWFFAEWLNRSGVPHVSGSWRYDSAGKQIVVKILQTQSTDPFRFSLGLGIAAAANGAVTIRRVEISGREATVNIPSDVEPASLSLDPGVWLLAEFGPFQKETM